MRAGHFFTPRHGQTGRLTGPVPHLETETEAQGTMLCSNGHM